MARLSEEAWVHEVARYAGMSGEAREDPSSAVQLVCSQLAAELPSIDRKELARELPFALLEIEVDVDVGGDVYARVGEGLHLPLGAAIELTEAVLRVLGANVDDDLRVRLEKHLPSRLVAHLHGPPPSAPPPRSQHPVANRPAPKEDTTLAGARR